MDGRYKQRMTELFGLEGLVQPPCNEQVHLELHQVAQSPIQPDLECFQGWDIHHLSGNNIFCNFLCIVHNDEELLEN